MKIDAGCAFYYSDLRYDRNDDPRNKKVFISPGDAYRVFDFTMRDSNQGVEKINEAVLDWVKAVQEAIEVYQLTQYEVNAPWVFVGMALQALERGLWEEFVQDLKRYGVPSELLATLVEYKEQHPVLLTIIDNPELSNHWYTNLVQRKSSEISHFPKADLTEKELVEEKSSRWCMVS